MNSNSFLRKPLPASARPPGFSLVEVTLALGIAAFALIAIFGLMPVGMRANQSASEQTIASQIASVIIADLRTANGSSTPLYGINTATGGTLYFAESRTAGNTGFSFSITPGAQDRYRATVTLTPPASGSRKATFGTVTISWPAKPDPANALGTFKTVLAIE